MLSRRYVKNSTEKNYSEKKRWSKTIGRESWSSHHLGSLSISDEINYTFGWPRSQSLALPVTIIQYLLHHPRGYLRLQYTCKIFYSKAQTLAIDKVILREPKPKFNQFCWRVSSTVGERWFTPVTNFDHIPFKIWLIGELSIFNIPLDLRRSVSSILSKVRRCNISSLKLHHQDLTFDEFKLLTDSGDVEYIKFNNVSLQNDDETVVELDRILAQLPNVRKFML